MTTARKMPPLRLLVAGAAFSVCIVSGLGVAIFRTHAVAAATGAVETTADSPARRVADSHAGTRCSECGVIESTRIIVQSQKESERNTPGLATNDGLTESSARTVKVSDVTVRMSDGSIHQFVDANLANWRPGERLIFIEGQAATNR